MRTNETEKTRREALLTAQGNTCALCHEPMPTAFRMLLIEKQNAIICRACGQFMSVYTNNIKRGVTPEALAVFLAKPPAVEPTSADVVVHKKLSPEQIRSRYHIATVDGPARLAAYDLRFGYSGPVVSPTTGLVWESPTVAPAVDDTSAGPHKDHMFIEGQWNEVKDGAWVPIEGE